MDYKEIVEILKNNLDGVEDFAFSDFNPNELGLGEVKSIPEGSQGGEGRGEHWVRVFNFINHNIFISVTGFYTSYDGTDFSDGWDSLKEVIPVTKTVVVYE